MNRATILMYHIVGDARSKKEQRFCTTPDDFRKQMEFIIQEGYTAVSIDELTDFIAGNREGPEKPLAITFDDGFSSVLEYAAPILSNHSIPATMFVVADRIAGKNDWMIRTGFPERNLLSLEGIRSLQRSNFTIGSHTCTHVRLAEVSGATMLEEIATSKTKLEQLLGEPINHFAYPFGSFDENSRNEAEAAGYRSACSTRAGFNRRGEDIFLLRRIDIYGTDQLWQFKQKLQFGINDASRSFPMKYYAKRLSQRLSRH